MSVIQLPFPAESPNMQFLGSQPIKQIIRSSTQASFTLQQSPIVGLEHVYKNGALLDSGASPPDYVLVGSLLTLHTALLITDVLVISYPFALTP